MAILQGTITDTGQIVLIDVPTTRIPERQQIEEIADEDRIPIWDEDENLTKYAEISQVRDKINGAAIPETPVVQNGVIYYTVPAVQNESTRVDIPALAGKVYEFERRPYGPYHPDEYNVLSTGGVELTQEGDKFYTGDKLTFKLVQYQAGGDIPGNGGGASGFVFKAIVRVVDSIPLTKDHMGKLISISGGDNKIVLPLPDVTTVDENSIIGFETMINNQWQSSLPTSNGQNIYFRGASLSNVYMGLSEILWLQAGSDGWYVVNSDGHFLSVGLPFAGYGNELNAIRGQGQLLKRDAYPRLWEYAQSLGESLVSDATWKSSINYSGCFSTGDDTGTTFRVPDLRGTTPGFLDAGRGLNNAPRTFNKPGGYGPDQMPEHDHTMHGKGPISTSDGNKYLGRGRQDYSGRGNDFIGQSNAPDESLRTGDAGQGTENSIKSIGFHGMIRA